MVLPRSKRNFLILPKACKRRGLDEDICGCIVGRLFPNEQPWWFLVGRNGDDTFAKILDSLVEFNQSWALGYLGDTELLSDVLKAREVAERTRKSFAEFVFSA
jgi:hypothetical protein